MNIGKGDRFGKLTVIKDSGKRYHKHIVFECLCDCGNTHLVWSNALTQGSTKSCGCLKHQRIAFKHKRAVIHKDIDSKYINKSFNRLTIISFKHELYKPKIAVCQCSCGNIIDRNAKEVIKGRVKSCGCIKKEIELRGALKREEKARLSNENKPYIYSPRKDFMGLKFGMLNVLYLCGVHVSKNNIHYPIWYCQCDCGEFVIRRTLTPLSSCGCTVDKEERNKRYMQSLAIANISLQGMYNKKREEGWTPRDKGVPKSLRRKVLDRDSHSCRRCGATNTKEDPIHVHHILSYCSHITTRRTLSNCIALCEKCHDRLHKTLGFIDPPVREQMNFILNIDV